MEFKDPGPEVKDLQRCMNDLVSVLALPAVWSGSGPDHILATFLDALSGMLDLDFLYCRVTLDAGKAPIESIRIIPSHYSPENADQIYSFLSRQFGEDARQWPTENHARFGEKDVSILPFGLGLEGEIRRRNCRIATNRFPAPDRGIGPEHSSQSACCEIATSTVA